MNLMRKFMNHGIGKTQRNRLPKGMSIVLHKNDIIVQLYNTNIVVLDDTDNITLDCGGFKTVHTKKCMNLFFNKHNIPLLVYQKNHIWYIEYKPFGAVEFKDGMRIAI